MPFSRSWFVEHLQARHCNIPTQEYHKAKEQHLLGVYQLCAEHKQYHCDI
jgi:hypothetical protein